MKILLTVNAAWNVWNFRMPVIRALQEDGHSMTVLAPEDEFVPKFEALGCRFVPLAMDLKGTSPARDVALAWRLRRQFAAERPDLILSYTIKNNVYGAMAARSLGIPFIPNVTGLGTAFLSSGLLRSMTQTLYRNAFANLPVVFFQNDDDRSLFIESRIIHAEQAQLLPGSGIDLDHFVPAPLPEPGAGPAFLMIARLLRDKGVMEFAEAARRVRARFPQARFRLLGATNAPNRSAIDLTTVRAWELSHGIEYLGTSTDVRPHIAAAHCVVLPSYREGAPRTLLEAAAMARPVIATDVPGCRSVVHDGHTGLLCEARSGESLASACLRFIALSREAQVGMGEAGRGLMEREFNQELVVAAYRKAITRLAPFVGAAPNGHAAAAQEAVATV